MKANFACPLDSVVARRSVSVWRRRVEKCCVGEPSKARASWKPVMVELLLWLVVVVLWLFVGLLCYFCARVTIFFSYHTVRTNSAME